MAFRENKNQQLAITDSAYTLTDREMRFLEKSWAKPFSEIIFPAINESDFSVLYSNKDSRPNTPVNVIIGSLLLKEIHGLTDDEIVEALMFDIRYQYALHTTSFQEQPLSDRTLGRFRERCLAYESETGIDLIKNSILQLSEELTSVMGIKGQVKRMDSMMIASNIKKLSRFELIYSCVARFVKHLKNKQQEIPEKMMHYTEKEDYSKMVYHMKTTDISERFKIVLQDAQTLIDKYRGDYDQSADYQLLIRVINEQSKKTAAGKLELKEKTDKTMNSQIVQNPADPEATYRSKAGKSHKGYTANLTETLGDNSGVISDYNYQANTYSDSQFLKDYLNETKLNSSTTILADGAYGGAENQQLAASKNINLVTTNFQGKKPDQIIAEFKLTEDGKRVLACANGHQPKTSKYDPKTENCRITLARETCDTCPYKQQCKPTFHKTKASKVISWKSVANANHLKYMTTTEFKEFAKKRNGVESLVSILRRKYKVDTMPVRGKLRSKLYFGFKVGALNFKKLLTYVSSQVYCAQKLVLS